MNYKKKDTTARLTLAVLLGLFGSLLDGESVGRSLLDLTLRQLTSYT